MQVAVEQNLLFSSPIFAFLSFCSTSEDREAGRRLTWETGNWGGVGEMKSFFLKDILRLALLLHLAASSAMQPSLSFSNYTWSVRSGTGGPGPNQW